MIPNPDEFVEAARNHPAPAIPLDEASTLLYGEDSTRAAPAPEKLAPLSRHRDQLRLLVPPTRRWAGMGPREWIVVRGGPGGPRSPRSILGRLRESLRRIGEGLEPGSTVQLARWERLLQEERKVRRALHRRLRSTRVGPDQGAGESTR